MRSNYSLWTLLLTLIFWSNLVLATVAVSIDRNPVHVNESFQLFFESSKSIDGDPDFSPLQQYFQILNRSQSNNISIINGQYQRSMKWTLQVMPRQEGEFILPEIQFGDDKSELLRVTVKPASQSTTPGGEDLIFELTSNINGDDASLYVQSQVIITQRLLSASNIAGYQMGDLEIEDMDVVIEPLGDINQYQISLDDKPYLVLERQFALFPQQSGALNIGPILAEVQYGSRSRSIFDPFQSNNRVKQVRSKQLSLNVLAKPESSKTSHWLPSTAVQLSEDWQEDLTLLTAGEPVTRIIRLTAEGLTAAQLPELIQSDVPGIKQYTDKPVFDNQRSSKGINSVRLQKIAIIPAGAGRYTLPEITVPWWNINTGIEEIARIPARTIEVLGAVKEAVVLPSDKESKPTITDQPVNMVASQTETKSVWMWISVMLAVGWVASMLMWWFMHNKSHKGQIESMQSVDISLRTATRNLRRACAENNAIDARKALLRWANALEVSHQFSNLNQVMLYFGDPLKQQINLLNQSIYSTREGEWSGKLLWQNCEEISIGLLPITQPSAPQGLYPLNP